METSAGAENNKAFSPGKAENEGIQRIPSKTDRRAGLILLLAEKCPKSLGADEHNPTDILTPDLTSLPPSRPLI